MLELICRQIKNTSLITTATWKNLYLRDGANLEYIATNKVNNPGNNVGWYNLDTVNQKIGPMWA